jgi:hypothetical protein
MLRRPAVLLLEEHHSARPFAMLLKRFSDREGLAQFERAVNARRGLDCPCLLRVIEVHVDSRATMCSQQHTAYVLVEMPRTTLKEEHALRRVEGLSYSDQELWTLILRMSTAMHALESLGLETPPVVAEAVFVEEGAYRVIEPGLLDLCELRLMPCLDQASPLRQLGQLVLSLAQPEKVGLTLMDRLELLRMSHGQELWEMVRLLLDG